MSLALYEEVRNSSILQMGKGQRNEIKYVPNIELQQMLYFGWKPIPESKIFPLRWAAQLTTLLNRAIRKVFYVHPQNCMSMI